MDRVVIFTEGNIFMANPLVQATLQAVRARNDMELGAIVVRRAVSYPRQVVRHLRNRLTRRLLGA